jgi:Domain of unknown function (DUF5078)
VRFGKPFALAAITVAAVPMVSKLEEAHMQPQRRARRTGARSALRAAIAVLTGALAATALPATAAADATEDYPIPSRILHTSCTAEQLLGAARDYEPIYYERYMIDMHNKPPQTQQSAQDGIHYFLSLDYAGRRDYSEQMVTNFADPLTAAWPNWAKIFFNNKGVAAKETDHCSDYPPADQSVWEWSPAR